MKKFTNKVVLITGASKGIGNGIAQQFALEGAHVAFTYQSSIEQAQHLAVTLQQYGVQAKGYKSNAANLHEAISLMENVLHDFGQLDILVNNAGITRDNLLVRMQELDWDTVLQVNLKSVFNTTKSAAPYFMKQRNGVIINITSIIGIKGNPGQTNYAASKAGIIGFTKSLALELGARNIRVNAIAPGWIETDMTANLIDEKQLTLQKNTIPLKRIGTPEDIAHCATFLASKAASYITGQVIAVDGGLLAK